MKQAEWWIQVRSIFEETIEQPEDSREEFLNAACGGNEQLRVQVARLLRHYSDQSSFLEEPPSLVLDLGASAAADAVFLAGQLVCNRFRIVRLLAFGGMGEVYEAEDEMLNCSRVALKTVRAGMAWDHRMRTQFCSEVELAHKVTHPNVCRIHDLGVHRFSDAGGAPAEVLVLTMELLRGKTLADRLRRGGALSETEAQPLILDILDALTAAHAAQVVHGDLKPNNIMLVEEKSLVRAVITDFGLAQGVAAGAPGELAERSVWAGAPAYMAPELLAGGAFTPASDMYALGAVMFEMLTGARPFPDDRTFEEARHHAGATAPSLKSLLPNAGARWERLTANCLHSEPAKRPDAAAARTLLVPRRIVARRDIAIVALLLAASAGAGWTFAVNRGDTSAPRMAIAVLPFENGSGEASAQYAADGLSDEIRESLAHIPGVRVSARVSSSEVAKARMSYGSAGQRLGAKYVVTGVLRRSDGRLRTKVRLVEAATGLDVWRGEFDKGEAEALSAKLEISAALASQLNLHIASQTAAAISRGGTNDPAAYDLYLRARHALATRRTGDMESAVELFGQALHADPRFALAWTGQAEAWEILAGREKHPFIESMTEARRAALRALELEPELPEALLEIGMIRQRFEWDWKGAEAAFQRAVATYPNSAEAHRLYAGFLSNLGRSDKAIQEIELARILDPLSLRVRHLRAVILLRARKYAEAASELERLLRENPDYQNLYAYTGDAYALTGQWDKALELHRESVRRFGAQSQFLYNLAYVLARTGATDEARQIVNELERRWPVETFLPTYLAKVYIALKDDAKAFYWLEKAWTERDASLMVLNVEPWYDAYRADPRFQDLVRRLGLNL